MDALRATLPAGTLSGAPKVRAMQIIDELEPHKRCSYGGAIGYLGFDGDLDTAIHIRTVVVKDGQAHVQAGGGTVADAKPDYEYRESLAKAEAVFRAIELAAAAAGVAVMKVLVIDNYDSFTYNLVQYLGELGAEVEVVRNDVAEVVRPARPRRRPPGDLARAVHSGRRGHLDRGLAGLPRGGRPHPRRLPGPPVDGRGVRRPHDPRRADPRQGRRDRARRQRACSPGSPSPLRAGRYHSLIADPDLPAELEVTATYEDVVMAVRHRSLPAEGVQFHPESVLTPQGKDLLRNFLARGA